MALWGSQCSLTVTTIYCMHTTELYACILLALLPPSVFMIRIGVFAFPQNKGEATAENNITAGERLLSNP